MSVKNPSVLPPMGWNFDTTYMKLPLLFYQYLEPVPVRDPELVLFNHRLAAFLGLEPELPKTASGVAILAGNRLPPGARPLAQAYAGHQFGGFTMLGDGRAILLGEQITPSQERFDIQLKGSGQTPFSRQGDGRAALGPMLREYLISEAMHGLAIPTSRSLAVVTTGESVRREKLLPGAILTRVATSHLRVGTFEYAAWRGTVGDVKTLADYTILRHYPETAQQENPYHALLDAVIERQAALIARWLLVGFIHGVMNTDNVSIAGETIDYGPCAFMDSYNPATVFSSIDHQGRYAYANQPRIAQWNLARFAETLLPLLAETPQAGLDLAQESIATYEYKFRNFWLDGMRAKLGFFAEQEGDDALIDDLLAIMQRLRADYTNSFRNLAPAQLPPTPLFRDEEFLSWYKRRQDRLLRQQQSPDDVIELMNSHNPAVIPRNHWVEEALQTAEQGDLSLFNSLLNVFATPYAEVKSENARYCEPPPPSDRVYQTFCGT